SLQSHNQLDWINPEGRQYPHDLRQPLPLVPNSQGRRVIPFHHFINNDLEYLRGGVSSRKYSTSVTKTTAADYGHIKWIEDLVPNSMWSQIKWTTITITMHSIPSMYYDYDAHVKGELLVMMKNSQSVNLLIFISNTLIEIFNVFGRIVMKYLQKTDHVLKFMKL
ncbi:hypothetical protein Tco_1199828, partial [Tanacetum coccineum]